MPNQLHDVVSNFEKRTKITSVWRCHSQKCIWTHKELRKFGDFYKSPIMFKVVKLRRK